MSELLFNETVVSSLVLYKKANGNIQTTEFREALDCALIELKVPITKR